MQGNKCVLFIKPKGRYEEMRREGFAAGIAAGLEETRRMGHLLTYLAVKKDTFPVRWQTNPERMIRFLHASSIDDVRVESLDENIIFTIRFDECLFQSSFPMLS